MTQNALLYHYVYQNPDSAQGTLIFQLSNVVFPIFDLIIPCGFILYTHNCNFHADKKIIDQQYRRYSSRVRYTEAFKKE